MAALSKAVRRARAGLKDPKRPIGSFLFLGTTGVGKLNWLVPLLLRIICDETTTSRPYVRIYGKAYRIAFSRCAPGYVGCEEGGPINRCSSPKPYSRNLYSDEVEKAHADFFNILLQVLDDGRLTDSQGRTVDFRNIVIIMTSNLGAKALRKDSPELGFLAAKKG